MMSISRKRPISGAVGALCVFSLVLTGCSVGQIGGGSKDAAGVTAISFLVQNDDATVALGQAIIKKFQTANPTIKVTLDTQLGGTDGDNLTKTKLSTGEMSDVFFYNDGSLLQALNPKQNLVPLTDQPWVGKLTPEFKSVVSTDGAVYGAPLGTTFGGGVLYNKKIYSRLGLKPPTTWSQFIENAKKVKADGKASAIEQTYGDTWTAQLFVLADFANVAAQDPDWSKQYTANKRKYADQPALQGFQNQQQVAELGLFNKDFASATFQDGVKAVATGTAANYPMLTNATSTLKQNNPDNVNDVGYFPLPAQSAADTRATLWLPNAVYIPKTTEGAKLDAAKKLVAFVNSPDGCTIQAKVSTVGGPFATSACTLPTDVPAMVTDLKPWLADGKVSPALEFVSPVKGPNLSQIAVEVGSKIRDGKSGAGLYDQDVKKQAQQLGLSGW